MENCNMKRGFFFLRDCDHPAHQSCSVCQASFCSEHLRIKPETNEPVCLDCLGRTMQQQQQQQQQNQTLNTRNRRNDYYDDYYYDNAWCYGYRSNYYSSSHYSPWYLGNSSRNNSQFNDQDMRVFDNSADINDPDAEAFDPEANVFDS
ncbi:MAG: hypothetical protein KKB51_17870 [Candidatus Riflebacteria bacterium]|nr:hypothetical protein [Candidatus Riflebacteria bacterium]